MGFQPVAAASPGGREGAWGTRSGGYKTVNWLFGGRTEVVGPEQGRHPETPKAHASEGGGSANGGRWPGVLHKGRLAVSDRSGPGPFLAQPRAPQENRTAQGTGPLSTKGCFAGLQRQWKGGSGCRWTKGVFSHGANYYVVYPGNTPENHPPTEACMIHSKQHRGCRMQDPGTRSYRWWKTADFSHSARCVPPNGGWWATKSVQNSGALWRRLGPFLGHIMVRASKGSKRSRERACIGGRGHQRGA